MAERQAPLSADEVRIILSICSPRGLLVGGQALAFWADHLAVPRPARLSSLVTADADFIGDSTLARELGRKLRWRVWIPSLDDATPQTGKVTKQSRDGVKEINFLSGVVGLTTKDVLRRAVEMQVPGIGVLRVMHPIDVLDSRIQNLDVLPEKRNETGVAQATLAVDMARAYVRLEIASHGERAGIKLLERLVAIAEDIAALRVFLLFAVDPLRAVPLEEFRTTTALHNRRWPQIERAIADRRGKLAKLLARPVRQARAPKRKRPR